MSCKEGDEKKPINPADFFYLVNEIAKGMHRNLPRHAVSIDDLIQSGMVGLMECVKKYKPSQASFQKYARYRIRGEIVEYLRTLDIATRFVRRAQRDYKETLTRLIDELGEEPTQEEHADALNFTIEEFHRMRSRIHVEVRSIEDEMNENRYPFALSNSHCPESLCEKAELQFLIKEILSTLPENDQRVLAYSYTDELTLAEIGRELDLSEGRICQIRTKALKDIRMRIDNPVKLGYSARRNQKLQDEKKKS